MAEKALAGVKVLEYAQFVSGPYCAKLLADLDAEVIKVEEPGIGDGARRRGPFPKDKPHPERSGLFLYVNTNKLGITLNLKTSTGRDLFKELIKQADILVEDNPPRAMKELGLDYNSLMAVNPRLIVTSITPFGQTGPYKDYKAYHLNAVHGGGEGYLLPLGMGKVYPDREPTKAGGLLGDYDAAVNAAVATLGALYAREATGQGQHVDVSKQESVIGLQRIQLLRYPNEGTIESRITRRSAGGADNLPCKDGYILVEAAQQHQWKAFVDFMGNPEWAKDERFQEEAGRLANSAEVNSRVTEWSKNHTKEEIYHGAQAKGVPVGIVATTEDLVNSPQLNAREFFVELDHPEAGRLKYPSVSYKLSKTPWAVERPAPLLGQHNEEIYCRRLGYSSEDLVKMRQAGII